MPPEFTEVEVPEQGEASAIAARLLTIADAQLERVVGSWTPHDFLALCVEHGAARYLSCVVAMLVATGRDEEALIACENAITEDRAGGFFAPEGTFSEMARKWLKARISLRMAIERPI